ncbi:lipocalin family protein [Cytophagaceae bacterium AH-315-L13]|nr:lipocalin family protein [Cytophagaceae bacterium AH-315-L13]
MKKITQPFIFAIIAVMLLTACSKEKTIKKQLAGTWTITEVVTITTIDNGTPTTDTDNSETETTFEKDGSGTASSSGSGSNPFPDDFTWSNTDETLSIVDTDDSSTTVYDIVENSNKKMVLNNTSSETISGDSYTYDVTITMTNE